MVRFTKEDVTGALKTAIERSVIKKEGKEPKVRNFLESIDVIINIKDVNLKDPKMRIQAEILLPNQVTDDVSALLICDGDRKLKADKLGYATYDRDDLEKIKTMEKSQIKNLVKKYKFFISQADLMRFVAQYLGRYLGPRSLMPIPPPNGFGVFQPSDDVEEVVDRYKSVVRLVMRKQPLIQLKVGTKDMSPEDLTQNIMAIVDFLDHKLPRGLDNIKSFYMKTTMGPPVRLKEIKEKKKRKRRGGR